MTTDTNIEEFKAHFVEVSNSITNSFYDKFKTVQLEKEFKEQLLTVNFIETAKIFLTLIKNAKPEIENYFKTESPHFNVFKILGLDRKEVLTHTPFLANLLSPFDSHQQSNLFLKYFLQQVLNFPNQDIENQIWNIRKEYEQIDLRIVNTFLRKAVFIENKIYTVAHSGQLSRYFKNWKENYTGGAFIYLTINGDSPPVEGFDETIYPKKEILSELIILSYKKDIYRWLESCIVDIQSKKVQYTVHQYLDLIKQL